VWVNIEGNRIELIYNNSEKIKIAAFESRIRTPEEFKKVILENYS
jgi:hypothetical protein